MTASITGKGNAGKSNMDTELFRLRNVETQLGTVTKHFIGDLVFTEKGVTLVQRARYTNLWGVLKYGFPMSMTFLFGPAAFPCAIAGGTIVFLSTGEKETFDIGAIIGAIASIPLSIGVISRINKTSQRKAKEMLNKCAVSDLTSTPQNVVVFFSKENLQQINYVPGERTLRLVQKKSGGVNGVFF